MRRAPFWLTAACMLLLAGCGSTTTSTAPAATTAPAAAATTPPASEATTAPTMAMDATGMAAMGATTAPTTGATAPAADATTAPATGATTAPATSATAATSSSTSSANAQVFKIAPDQSKVTYEVGEVFINQGNKYNLAVGTTQQVSGNITFDPSAPQNSKVGPITIDISTFKTDSDRRDNAIRDRWLESAKFPQAVFTPTKIDGLPTSYAPGQEITLQMTGDMKIRETTKPVTFQVTGKIENNTMTGKATSQIKMSDFGFEPPNILNILKAEDDVKLTLDFVAKP